MKTKLLAAMVTVLFTQMAWAYDDDVTPRERAEALTEQVQRLGILETVRNSPLSDRDAQMLDLILGLGLPGSERARDHMEEQLEGPVPEIAPEFNISHSMELMREITPMWDEAMDMLNSSRWTEAVDRPGHIPHGSPATVRYSVWVENQTTDTTVHEMVVFFKEKGNSVMQMRTIAPVTPGGVAMFELGRCSCLESYALGIYIGTEMVARIPAEGRNMTPQLASVIHPNDRDPCKDTWGFGK